MNILVIIFIFALIAIDQVTKYLALRFLKPQGSITIIENIFSLTFVENRGAAFGIFQGKTTILSIITTIITIFIIYFYIKLPKEPKIYSWLRFSLILIISGAIGNLIDRVGRKYVIDFFHATFIDFPVFNMADIYVVVGSILMAILVIFFIKED